MGLLTFPSLLDAQKAQNELDAPILVFAHAANESSQEEEATNPHLPERREPQSFQRPSLKGDFRLSSVKGRTAQRNALESVLRCGLLAQSVLVHEVQEGTAAYQMLVDAVPNIAAIPRVHLLPSRRSKMSFPVVLAENNFTAQNLLIQLQSMLEIPLGGAISAAQPEGTPQPQGQVARSVVNELLQQVESVNAQLSSRAHSLAVPSRPFTSPSSSASKSTATPQKAANAPQTSRAAAPTSPTSKRLPTSLTPLPSHSNSQSAVPPQAVKEPVTSENGEAKKRSSSLPSSENCGAPLSQRKKPEHISIRCSLPNGAPLTVEQLRPVSSTVAKDVRPVIRESLGHDNFDLVKIGSPPQRLDREKDEPLPLQSIGIITSSSLRVVVTSQPAIQPPPNAANSESTSTNAAPAQMLQQLMGALRSKMPGRGGTDPAPLSSAQRSLPAVHHHSNIRTMEDVLAAQHEEGEMPPIMASPGELPAGKREEMAKVLKRLFGGDSGEMPGRGEDDDEEHEEQAPTRGPVAFAGTGRTLRDSGKEEAKKKQ